MADRRAIVWRVLPGMSGVVGRACTYAGVTFVPIVGRFRYSKPRHFLKDRFDVDSLKDLMTGDGWMADPLWVRARLIRVFGVDHPTGHAMTTVLNFQCAAVEWDREAGGPKGVWPMLVSDTWRGLVSDYGYDGEASVAFERGVARATRERLAACFWGMMTERPRELGVFADYLEGGEGMRVRIECDGERLGMNWVEEYDEGDWESGRIQWPFKWPRKRRPNVRRRKRLAE